MRMARRYPELLQLLRRCSLLKFKKTAKMSQAKPYKSPCPPYRDSCFISRHERSPTSPHALHTGTCFISRHPRVESFDIHALHCIAPRCKPEPHPPHQSGYALFGRPPRPPRYPPLLRRRAVQAVQTLPPPPTPHVATPQPQSRPWPPEHTVQLQQPGLAPARSGPPGAVA